MLDIAMHATQSDVLTMSLQTYNELLQWNLSPEFMVVKFKPKKKGDRNCLLQAQEMKTERIEIVCVQIKDKDIMKSFFNLMCNFAAYFHVSNFLFFFLQIIKKKLLFLDECLWMGEARKTRTTPPLGNAETEETSGDHEKDIQANERVLRASRLLKQTTTDTHVKDCQVLRFLHSQGLTNDELRMAYIQAVVKTANISFIF
ncbi:hypothetical protein RFI_14839 [Reticulomyxa filosa]|uniref:Uncharacterized protein n=1 Tax=Reticulomyxa filosa TaxID=46433 RepID=X6N9D1_RETFI|nr:hypothetical protein RFI_14839 [Reticulomyxa filosa]|eukprot:ETO22359.1 hypothetical protein RFI_14839 [Reticulomyxa filosa]